MGTPRKVPLTLDEHRAIGRQLYDMRTAVVLMSIWIANTYGKACMRGIVRAEKRIDRVRCTLDDYVSAEYPALPDLECIHIYYPGHLRDHAEEQARWGTWEVPRACEALRGMVTDLGTLANSLYRAYPVALGDRLLRAANDLEVVIVDLPYWPLRGTRRVALKAAYE